jgi:acylphosphatase
VRRLSITVHGRVQGVGFRFFTADRARKHACTGWVRNAPDGGVEMEVQGDEPDLATFRQEINEGPVLSRVRKVIETEVLLVEGEQSFDVRY